MLRTRWPTGESTQGLSTRSGLGLSSSRTLQPSSGADLTGFSPTSMRWGSMRSGVCSKHPRPELHTEGSGSSLWPTPSAATSGFNQGGSAGRVGKKRYSLNSIEKLWPTPTASENANRTTRPSEMNGHGRTLAGDIQLWPTPTAGDANSSGSQGYPTSDKRNQGTTLTDATCRFPRPDTMQTGRDYLAVYPGLEPSVRRGSYGLENRADRLRVLGNGVVPDQAVLAYRELFRRLMITDRQKEQHPSLPRVHTACPTSTRPATARNRRSKIAPSETRISTASIVRPVSLEETNPGKPTLLQAEQTTNASTTRIAQVRSTSRRHCPRQLEADRCLNLGAHDGDRTVRLQGKYEDLQESLR